MISVITPTFNRAYILPKLYKSLCRQTVKDFEWIIIDDGSTDSTECLVKSWKEDAFPIMYEKRKNGGKHRALNQAIPIARYRYVFIVDSDDYIVENAIEMIKTWLDMIDGKREFAGVAGLRSYPNGEIVGKFPVGRKYIDTSVNMAKKNGIVGDKAEIYRKDLLLKYPFPEFKNENYIAEGSVWNNIAKDGYKLRYFSNPIYICDYLPDGLTRSSNLQLKNFQGYTYTEKINFKYKPFPENYLAAARFIEIARRKGLTYKEIIIALEINCRKMTFANLFRLIRFIRREIKNWATKNETEQYKT